MNKNAIKKYAIWARKELITRVTQKAYQYGISDSEQMDAEDTSINDHVLGASEKTERQALIKQIQLKGFKQVIEEVAYTWFNRFSALRFMEVNGYLPSHTRVFTDENNNFKPQIMGQALHLNLEGLDQTKVIAYKEANNNDELYKYLLITQCNALNKILPGMFQKIADYTELLFPDNLLREGSVIEQMISLIPQEDWQDEVQIIGWMYQYYNTEPKDKVFSDLKKKVKITKENIPAATQLFTPDWIVRYMVENSLGRLWLQGHPNNALKANWKYYLDEAEQEEAVKKQLDTIRTEYKNLKPEDIRCIDPCMGSGHILVYMFDVLMQIYLTYGYTQKDATRSIVEHNIYGLDIDDRAAQLAYFAVMMKARQYDSRFFSQNSCPHVYAIKESNSIDKSCIDYFVNGDAKLKQDMQILLTEMNDAKEYGSILNVSNLDFDAMYTRIKEIQNDDTFLRETVLEELLPVIQVAQVLAQKYDIVVTNPPYMGRKSLNKKLSSYMEQKFSDEKSELYSVFIMRCLEYTKDKGFTSMITIHSWMFLRSFEKIRNEIISNNLLANMIHTGAATFEELNSFNVLATTFCIQRHVTVNNFLTTFLRLTDYYKVGDKQNNYKNPNNVYITRQIKFTKISGLPLVYWASKAVIKNLSNTKPLSFYAQPKVGLQTGKNEIFVRNWFEVNNKFISFNSTTRENFKNHGAKWGPYNKGGNFRKWYGMNEYIVNWENDGYEIKHFVDDKGKLRSRPQNTEYYFKEGITWSLFGFENFGVRYKKNGFIFDVSGSSMFPSSDLMLYILAFLASKVAFFYLSLLAPTVNFQVGNIGDLPLIINKDKQSEIEDYAKQNINLSQEDWDDFEISWGFLTHPFIKYNSSKSNLEMVFKRWKNICNERFEKLKNNEENLNKIFIGMYKIEDDLDANVVDRDIALRKADLQRDIKSLISYAVGCMFGRYSLDVEGLAYAGGDWDATKYKTFIPDDDNIIPICDDEYFSDDIVGRFIKFVETVYGTDSLEENLQFVSDALGKKGTPREVIRAYFLNDFYKDHCKMYKKRPIYWLFDSGKQNGFKALIYMHRYQADTIARMRTDYVHEQQERYHTAIEHLQQTINNADKVQQIKLTKQIGVLQAQETEIRLYEEKIHHLADQMIQIDLDDGVTHNYEIFKDVLAKIK